VTRYDDVATVLKDERFAKDPLNALTPEQQARQPWMPAFVRPLMRNIIEQMRGRVQALCERLLDRAQGRRRLDLIRAYAQPVPTTIIAAMLGVPAADRRLFQRWSQALFRSGASRWACCWPSPTSACSCATSAASSVSAGRGRATIWSAPWPVRRRRARR
jgi:cytochrome P450